MRSSDRAVGPPRSAARAVTVASAGVLVCGASLLATSAQAAYEPVPENGVPGQLVLMSDPYPVPTRDLSPGEIHYWQVAATVEDGSRASLVLELRRTAAVEHPDGLVVTIERCDAEWTWDDENDPQCPSGRAPVTQATPSDDYSESSPIFDLDGVHEADGTHLLVAVRLEARDTGDESLMGLRGEIGLGLTAAAGDVSTPVDPGPPPDKGLPVTGVDPIGLLMAAVGAVGLGIALMLSRTRSSRGVRTVRSEGAAQLALPGADDRGER